MLCPKWCHQIRKSKKNLASGKDIKSISLLLHWCFKTSTLSMFFKSSLKVTPLFETASRTITGKLNFWKNCVYYNRYPLELTNCLTKIIPSLNQVWQNSDLFLNICLCCYIWNNCAVRNCAIPISMQVGLVSKNWPNLTRILSTAKLLFHKKQIPPKVWNNN